MYKKELYINNQIVDLPNGFSIGLNLSCSEVNDLNNLLTDYSSTIKLPLTTNNNRIFGLPSSPASENTIVYGFIDARYYISGIPIFENGKCVVAEVTDKDISINLFWSSFTLLDSIENAKLTDLSITESFTNNYRSTPYDGTYIEQLLCDFGETFQDYPFFLVDEKKIIDVSRFYPVYKVKPIFDLIMGGSSAYVMPSAILTHMASLRFATGTRKGNATITAATKIETGHNIYGVSNLVPLGRSSYDLHFFDDARVISDTYNLLRLFDFEGDATITANAKFMAAPAKGTYRLHGSIAVNPDAFPTSNTYVHPIIRVYSVAEGWEQESERDRPHEELVLTIDLGQLTSPMAGFPPSASFDETIELSGYNQTLRIVITTTTNISPAQTNRPLLGDYSGSFGVKETRIKIEYTDTNNNIGLLMAYPAKENLPDMTQKDFVKSILQLYSLMLAIKDGKPYFFRFNEVVNNIPYAKDWTNKLVVSDRPLSPEKMTFDLGVAKTNYFKYAKDELVNELQGQGIINTNYSIVNEKTIVQQAKFAASPEIVLTSQGVSIKCIYMKQHETKDNRISYAGKAKMRLGYKYTNTNSLEFDHKNVYNEDDFDGTFTTNNSFKFIGGYPGQGVDYNFDLINYFIDGYSDVIQKGKKLILKFALSAIDLHEFDYTIPVWLSQFNRYYFVKRITNWDAGVNCEVELIQLP